MPMEDYKVTNSNGVPIDLQFIPQALHADFKQKLKFQIAFYRNSKVCKTATQKHTKSEQTVMPIKLKQEALPFCTTINYDDQQGVYESKIINVQLAAQIDSNNTVLDGKLDLRDILANQNAAFEKSGLVVVFKNDVKLYYGVKVKVNNGRLPKSTLKINKNAASPSKNREVREDTSIDNRKPAKSGASKIISFKDAEEKENKEVSRKQQPYFARSEKIIRGITVDQESEKQIKTQKNLDLQLSHTSRKVDQASQQASQLKSQLKNFEQICSRKSQEVNEKIKQLNDKNREINQKAKQIRDKNKLITEKQQQIAQLNRMLRKLNEKVQKNADKPTFKSAKNIDGELVSRNQQIQKLEQQIEYYKGTNSELKLKVEQAKQSQSQYRSKYQESEKRNLKLTSQISQLQYELEKSKKQEQKIRKKVEKLQAQLAEAQRSHKSPDNVSSKQKDQEIFKLTKLLQSRQEMIKLIKKQTEHKKNEQEEDLSFLKKQNKDLKEQLEKLRSDKKDTSFVQLKVMNEKLKKENTETKREEKKLIVERSQLEQKTKEMHEQIIKLKQTIARIFNIVQEEGSPDLFTQVADCMS